MWVLPCGVALLLGAFVTALGGVAPVYADSVQCGDVLGPGGRYKLDTDLDCSNDPGPVSGPAFTLRSGAILDLNQHLLTCQFPEPCLVFKGRGATLKNGTLQGGIHYAIILGGQGGHTLMNVTSGIMDGNILVESDDNELINVMAHGVYGGAFLIGGNDNRLTNSVAHCLSVIGGGCISVGGNRNRLSENVSLITSSRGGPNVEIVGDDNVLQGNRAILSELGGQNVPGGKNGIVVTGTGNRLTRNTVRETKGPPHQDGIDLQDTSGDCDHNTWRHSTFRTKDPACIE